MSPALSIMSSEKLFSLDQMDLMLYTSVAGILSACTHLLSRLITCLTGCCLAEIIFGGR